MAGTIGPIRIDQRQRRRRQQQPANEMVDEPTHRPSINEMLRFDDSPIRHRQRQQPKQFPQSNRVSIDALFQEHLPKRHRQLPLNAVVNGIAGEAVVVPRIVPPLPLLHLLLLLLLLLVMIR